MPVPLCDTAPRPAAPLGRAHWRRLREVYRSAGWPCLDPVEIDLLAAGLLERLRSAQGHETLRLTDAGIAALAAAQQGHRAAFDAHEALVTRVVHCMQEAGRIAWRGLGVRARVPHGPEPVPPADPGAALRWCVARPDVFSIRNTSVAEYVEPVVHEVKVRRADLLADLRVPGKRAAYLDLGQCWYVLGRDARGRPIGQPDEIPGECGVMQLTGDRLETLRPAPPRPRQGLRFDTWMALAKAAPCAHPDEAAQALLGDPTDAAG